MFSFFLNFFFFLHKNGLYKFINNLIFKILSNYNKDFYKKKKKKKI